MKMFILNLLLKYVEKKKHGMNETKNIFILPD